MPFDAVGELAAQPGGQELSALVARAQRVDPEVLHGVGRGLAAMSEGVDGSLRALGRHGDDVRAAWQGRGADAVTGYLDDLGRAGVRTMDATGRLRARIDGAGQELAGMRREVDAHVSRALDAARRARAEALADPARAPIAEQLVVRAMAEPTAAARAAVARAEAMLSDAATAVRELAGDLTAFSRLPIPDTRPLAPAATTPASVGTSGSQGIDISGGGGSGDFTDMSSLDSGAGDCEADASVSEASDGNDSSSGDGPSSGTSADLDAAESDSDDASEASVGENSGPGDDGFTGTSADLDGADEDGSDSGDASVSEASDVRDSPSGDDGFTGTSADLDDPGQDGSGSGDASVSEPSDGDDSFSGDGSSTGTSADLDGAESDNDDASDSEASDAGDPSADAEAIDDRDAGSGDDDSSADRAEPSDDDAKRDDSGDRDAGGQGPDDRDADDRDADDRDTEGGAVTSASTGNGDAATATDAATPTGGPQGEVRDWIREAMAILQAEGVATDKMDPDDIATIIDHESGGDPEAINNWDSNADKGTPSQGLMQTIGPTFDSYKLAGHGEITDPVDNIIAGVRYAIARYGSVSEVPGVEAVARGDSYVGY